MNYPWLQQTWQQLLSQYHRHAVHHALLFAGAAGLGKQACAKAFGQLLLCENGHGKSKACGICQSCRWALEGTHPDVYTVTLQDKASTIKVDQIRELTEQLSQTAHRGGYQVVYLYPADALSLAASNALLKTLEEPSGNVVFILVTNHKDRLPITVKSRCQLQSFQINNPSEAEHWLATQINDPTISSDRLLRAAHGAPLLAITLVEEGYLELQERVVEQMIALLERKEQPVSVTALLMKLDIVRVFDTLLIVVTDLIKRVMGVSINTYILEKQQLNALPVASNLSLSMLQQWLSSCLETRALLQRHSGINTHMALESLLIQWPSILNNR